MGDKTLSHKFQSTLPRGERRYSPGTVHRQWHYFNPRSHEGSDVQKLVDKLSDITDFNPRSHEGSDYDKRERLNTDEVFQSTLPRGERRCINDLCIRDTQFQSTLPRGERQICYVVLMSWWIFQSTLPRGERPKLACIAISPANFNPRSHEGSDLATALNSIPL